MRTLSTVLTCCLLATFAGAALAQDADPCADEVGVALGLCTAYCEAMDCDGDPEASQTACDAVADNYFVLVGAPLSCGGCPCVADNGWPLNDPTWRNLATDPAITITECEFDGNTTRAFSTFQFTPYWASVTENGDQSSCSILSFNVEVGLADFAFTLSAEQAQDCADLLIANAALDGQSCD